MTDSTNQTICRECGCSLSGQLYYVPAIGGTFGPLCSPCFNNHVVTIPLSPPAYGNEKPASQVIDELRQRVKELEGQFAEAEDVNAHRRMRCVHCNVRLPISDDEMRSHWMHCVNSPTRIIIDELDKQLAIARAEITDSKTEGDETQRLYAAEQLVRQQAEIETAHYRREVDRLGDELAALKNEMADLKKVESAAFALGPEGCDPIFCIDNAHHGIRLLHQSPSQRCASDHFQACHACENAACGDNLTPSIVAIKSELAHLKFCNERLLARIVSSEQPPQLATATSLPDEPEGITVDIGIDSNGSHRWLRPTDVRGYAEGLRAELAALKAQAQAAPEEVCAQHQRLYEAEKQRADELAAAQAETHNLLRRAVSIAETYVVSFEHLDRDDLRELRAIEQRGNPGKKILEDLKAERAAREKAEQRADELGDMFRRCSADGFALRGEIGQLRIRLAAAEQQRDEHLGTIAFVEDQAADEIRRRKAVQRAARKLSLLATWHMSDWQSGQVILQEATARAETAEAIIDNYQSAIAGSTAQEIGETMLRISAEPDAGHGVKAILALKADCAAMRDAIEREKRLLALIDSAVTIIGVVGVGVDCTVGWLRDARAVLGGQHVVLRETRMRIEIAKALGLLREALPEVPDGDVEGAVAYAIEHLEEAMKS